MSWPLLAPAGMGLGGHGLRDAEQAPNEKRNPGLVGDATHTHIYIYIYTHININICVYIYTYVCMCVCLYIHAYVCVCCFFFW